MLGIRADANHIVATGHMMRCCAIAEAAVAYGEDVMFFSADQTGKEIAEGKGFAGISLNTSWNDLENEIDVMYTFIERYRMNYLLVDSYYVTEKYLEALAKKTIVIYLDDINAFSYPCQIIVNYSIHAEVVMKELYGNKRKLLGCNYAPLRTVFSGLPLKYIREKIERIVVFTGGSDPYHFACTFAACISEWKQYKEISFDLICGRYNEDLEILERLSEQNHNLHIIKNVINPEWYMQQADIAISAGGTTLYELCACGTPTICYTMADNQNYNIQAFVETGLMQSCGDIRNKEYMEDLKQCIDDWLHNQEERRYISKKMQELVDGKGAARIVQEIII